MGTISKGKMLKMHAHITCNMSLFTTKPARMQNARNFKNFKDFKPNPRMAKT
jgi:hypothetical protein